MTSVSLSRRRSARSAPSRRLFGRPFGLVCILFYKTIWGLIEVFLGVFLFLSPRLIANELVDDPQDLFLQWFLHYVHLAPSVSIHLGELIVFLGLSKLLLAAALWFEYRSVRKIGMVVYTILGIFGLLALLHLFSWYKLIAWIGDLLILIYFWKVLPRHFPTSSKAA